MRLSFPLLLLVLAHGSGRAEDHLQSAAEINDYIDRTSGARVTFAMTGTVMRTDTTAHSNLIGTVLLSDATGRVILFNAQKTQPKPGDIIEVGGSGAISPAGSPVVSIHRMKQLGTAALPEPVSVPLDALNAEAHAYQTVCTEGTLIEVIRDELDSRSGFLLLKERSAIVPVFVSSVRVEAARKDIGARLRVCGRYHVRIDGIRRFSGPYIDNIERYETICPPPSDPFDVPDLDFRRNQSPKTISQLEKRQSAGFVRAVWETNKAIVLTDAGFMLNVELADGLALPRVDSRIQIVGYPQTDLFRIKLVKAQWKLASGVLTTPDSAKPLRLDMSILRLGFDRFSTDPQNIHGQLVQTQGIVQNFQHQSSAADAELRLTDGAHSLCVICPRGINLHALPQIGSTVRVTGICNQPSETWQPYLTFPHVYDCQVVLRDANGIETIRRAPWLTPLRVTILLIALGSGLLLVIFWNRRLNRLVARRGRELAREQLSHLASELRTEERTRLAVELHDALSQNLAAIACLVGTSENAVCHNPRLAQDGLRTANRILQSCRTELRHCLFDLRNNMLDETDFNTAISKTLRQLESNAEMRIRVDIPRSHLHESTAQTILSILRELVSNAIRHGQASTIMVAGSIANDTLLFSVTDNGIGFDPSRCNGPTSGHFGLDGIRQRLAKRNGRLTIESRLGRTHARMEIPLPHIENNRNIPS